MEPLAQRKRPSDRAIAFAVSIVHSKPQELTIREYINLLRQHVAKGRRENAISSVYRHLDRSSYWRAESERNAALLKAAENQTVGLRREVDTLKTRLEITKASPTKKRKKADNDIIPVPRSPKKARRDASPGRRPGVAAARVDSELGFDFASTGEVGNILMRSLYQVNAILRVHQMPDPVELAHCLVRAASSLPQVVDQAVGHRPNLPPDTDQLKTTLTAAGRASASLVVGFHRLARSTDGDKTTAQVVYVFVHMFAKLLDVLAKAAAMEAGRISAPELATPTSNKSSPTKSKAKSRPTKASNIKDNADMNIITTFLCSILDLLTPNVAADKAVFEGFTYCVLDKLGSRVYQLTFGHECGESLSDEIARSNIADEIEDAPASTLASPEDTSRRQAKLEAPYLIHLLTKIMNAAPGFLGSILSTRTGKPKQANNKGSMKGALAIAQKDRLQRTLANCMFGTEGMDVEDPFMDCLKMPILAGQPLPTPKVKEVEVKEWFKEEVWRLLGWEILGKKGDW